VRESNLRTIWAKGGAVVNGWLGIPSAVAAENMAQAGWDSLTCDLQHGLVDYQAAIGMMQAVSTTPITPLCRVPWLEPGIIMKLLDAGSYGIICPMINTRAECEALVGACRYAPKGYRSFGPARAVWYAGADYAKQANDTVVCLAMIETRKALDNLDEILTVPGLDGIYVGPADLGLSLGGEPRGDQTEPKVYAAIEQILAATKKHKVRAGIHCSSTAYAKKMIGIGYQFVTVMSDNGLLNAAAKNTVAEMRQGGPAQAKPAGAGGPY
jgi:4-hydroxy-2-oxoheptanedioate aldolase